MLVLKEYVMNILKWTQSKAVRIIALCGVGILGYILGKKVYLKSVEDDDSDDETGNRHEDKERLQRQLRDAEEGILRLQAEAQGQNRSLLQRINELTTKLSAEMGKKVAADESSVENVNIKNRPMNIADEYVHFCSNEWLNAKTALDEEDPDGLQEVDKVQLLFNIIMVSEEEMRSLHRYLLGDIQRKLYNPCGADTTVSFRESEYSPQTQRELDTKTTLPIQITNVVGDFLRTQADTVDLNKMLEKVLKVLDNKMSASDRATSLSTLWLATRQNQDISQYISACLRLCWKMATQRPPMAFKIADEYAGDKFHELYWKSEDPAIETQTKLYHVFPMLCHGTSLMAKGKVFLMKS